MSGESNKASTSSGEDVTDKQEGSSSQNERVLPPQPSRPFDRRNNPFYLGENIENPASDATINEANGLYLMHLARQMSLLGYQLGNLDNVSFLGPNFNIRPYTTTPRNVRRLRTLADEFASSPQRQWVHEQADNVDMDSLNFNTFQQLLNGLFEEGGVTWERVLVLFYFCTDLSLRALQETFVNHFVQIYQWTSVFLSGRFSAWVEQQGGWGVVLQNSVNYVLQASILGACAVAVLAVCLFLRNR